MNPWMIWGENSLFWETSIWSSNGIIIPRVNRVILQGYHPLTPCSAAGLAELGLGRRIHACWWGPMGYCLVVQKSGKLTRWGGVVDGLSHHLQSFSTIPGGIKPCKWWDKLPQLVCRISEPSNRMRDGFSNLTCSAQWMANLTTLRGITYWVQGSLCIFIYMWSPPNYYIIICETNMNQYLEGKIKFKRFFQGPQRLSETQISCSGHDKMKYRFGINIGSVIIIQRRYLPIGWICSWQIRCNRFLLTGIFFWHGSMKMQRAKGCFGGELLGFCFREERPHKWSKVGGTVPTSLGMGIPWNP